MNVLIPAYNPDSRLIQLVKALQARLSIVIVDDGSGADARGIFEQATALGCVVLRHGRNQGKGAALKTGAAYIAAHGNAGYVTADADMQHLPEDVIRVAAALDANPHSLILGCRDFSGPYIPFKSRWGNRVTSAVFFLLTGIPKLDTQTGLRGIPASLAAEYGAVPGSRFEYEMNALLWAVKAGVPLTRVPISTVYVERNKSSSFHPLRDSLRIYGNIAKFALSSLACAAIDFISFYIFTFFFNENIMLASVAARLVSGACNFTVNRTLVFRSRGKTARSGFLYGLLFVTQMLLSGFCTARLAAFMPPLLAKLFVDSLLFVCSYIIQKKFIFRESMRYEND